MINIHAIRAPRFKNNYSLRKHYDGNADCKITYNLENAIIKCENENGNTWWADKNDMRKHTEYHCRLNKHEKEMFGNLATNLMKINRRDTQQQGIPINAKLLANCNVEFDNIKNGSVWLVIKKAINIIGGKLLIDTPVCIMLDLITTKKEKKEECT